SNTVGRGHVSFGTFGTPQHYGISDVIADYLADFPEVRLRVVGRNSSTTAEAVRTGALDAAVIALPIDAAGLEVRPIYTGEVVYVSTRRSRTRQPVRIEDLAERPFILYEALFGTDDPTRRQLSARAQAAGVHIDARVHVEFAETALDLAARGVADTYAPQVMVAGLDRRLSAVSFDPPLIDTFALISRTGARLSRPVSELTARVAAHFGRLTTQHDGR
ncbi:MAG TPA: LysR family transcriptional regulator substrate-binding protein, partial [Ilumatobacteraceae bacterium]